MISRGSEDSIRDHPDAPRRTRRKSRLSMTDADADMAALRKRVAQLQRERADREHEGEQGTLL